MAQVFSNVLNSIAGKTIAIVYIFEGETAQGSRHYDVWRTDVITAWLKAVQELRCLPLILDVRTFANKALNGTLPRIDYVINLNNGNLDISTLSLVPSVCAFLAIPCIPCDSATLLTGESKMISNLIAASCNIVTPKDLPSTSNAGINRPNSMGSSIGVVRGERISETDLYQEFIQGFDMTTPILYHPILRRLEVLPPIMYYPDNNDLQWYLGEKEKATHASYKKLAVAFDDETREHYLKLAKKCGITTFCRIDSRVFCSSQEELHTLSQTIIPFERVRFIEINPMPTIKEGINFLSSLNSVETDNPFYSLLNTYMGIIQEATMTGFILSCSILALSKPDIKE